ncbi:HYC_CC_PP family protein [Pedobacter endophyticus]|uniref:Uncharacterized protein n=1 Tax=Pedobacter endophyticus TaxID=2789740 RepID=A0A7S9L1C0_9SPHI|nr:hypothetical protein [Pedobacter endophyticus]QPH40667.1 hypothetical protein IZT61_05175 [Pedobacter endophyticus]
MKRILIIAILTVYSIASFGISVNHFYCCGKLKEVSLAANVGAKCLGEQSSKGCCENKTVTVKLKADQKSNSQSIFHFDPPFPSHLVSTAYSFFPNVAIAARTHVIYSEPNRSDRLPRHLFFCVFII